MNRATQLVAVAAIGVLSLSACTGTDSTGQPEKSEPVVLPSTEPTPPASSGSESQSPSPEPSGTGSSETAPSESAKPEGGSGSLPAWARPFEIVGTKIGTVKNGDLTIDIYQVAVDKASKDSIVVDKDTRKPLVAEGDDIVYVNYVITNTGDTINLGASLVSIDTRYPDWKYMGGMPGITDSDQMAKHKVVGSGVKPKSGDAPYPLAKGETFAFSENFKYEKGKELEVGVTVTPVNSDGKLDHDKRVKSEGSAKLN